MRTINKKIYMIFVILLIVTLLSFCAISSTFAKFTSTISGSATVNIAKFSNSLNGQVTSTQDVEINIFGSGFDIFSNKVSYDTFATSIKNDFKISIEDASDVNVAAVLKIEDNSNSLIPLTFVYGTDVGNGYQNQYSNILGNIKNLSGEASFGGDLNSLTAKINQDSSSTSFPIGGKAEKLINLNWYVNFNEDYYKCLGYVDLITSSMSQVINDTDLDFEYLSSLYLTYCAEIETLLTVTNVTELYKINNSTLTNITSLITEVKALIAASALVVDNSIAKPKLTHFNNNITSIRQKYLTQRLKVSCTFNQVI